MSTKRKSFSTEFKNESACLVLDKDYTVTEACESMGVSPTSLRKWVVQLEDERNGVAPKSRAITPEQKKIQELELKIKQIEWEKYILKKATALLMSDTIKR